AVEQMVDLQTRELAERMEDSGLSIHLTEPARYWLAKKGYDPQFGARPLRRAVQRHIETPLSIHLLKGDFNAGDLVLIDEQGDQLGFTRHADQQSVYEEGGEAAATDYAEYYEESIPVDDYYDAKYADEDFADFLSQTDDDDEFDHFPAPRGS
ncbi:MAG: hypothetical protein OXG78_03825, partial [Chloroflexi bacterium]|nr:hypothetical protein [Chloroflexota bacterium]